MVVRRREKIGGGGPVQLFGKKKLKSEGAPVKNMLQPGAPTDGYGSQMENSAGIGEKEPASGIAPASHERWERKKRRK
jgi:hypothetical protein